MSGGDSTKIRLRRGRPLPHPVHGRMKDHPKEWRAWQSIIHRCELPGQYAYHRYGGRGITICDRWRRSFWAFFEDVGPAPSTELTIDRIDNDRGYEPGNTRWVDRLTQAYNKSSARGAGPMTFRGVARSAKEWARLTGISRSTIQRRVVDLGWSMERALTTPPKPTRPDRQKR